MEFSCLPHIIISIGNAETILPGLLLADIIQLWYVFFWKLYKHQLKIDLIYFLVHLHDLNVHKWSVGVSPVYSILMKHNTLLFLGLSSKSESHLCIYSGQFSRYKWAGECLCGSCGHLTVPPSVANGQFLWFDVGGMCSWSPSIPTSPLIDRTHGRAHWPLTFMFKCSELEHILKHNLYNRISKLLLWGWSLARSSHSESFCLIFFCLFYFPIIETK